MQWGIVAFLAVATLPELPKVNTSNFLPVVRTQIERAAADAAAHPREAAPTAAFAMTLHAYQQYDTADRAYLRAHLLDPKNFDWIYLRGVAQMEDGQFEEAAKSLAAALLIHPGHLAAEVRLAEALMKTGMWEEAGARCSRVVASHPDCAQAWYGLGRAKSAQGDHAGAIEAYIKACDLFPRYGAAHFALAGELRRSGRPDDAKEHLAIYSKNVTTEPPLNDPLFASVRALNSSATAHMRRGAELEQAGNIPEAIREHEAALEADPSNVQVHINLISLYARSGDATKAKQHFQASVEQNPGRADAWYNYGVLMAHEGNDAEAEQAFLRAVALNPSYAEAHNNLGAMYQQHGRLEDAANEFRKAIADKPDFPLARFHLGRILANEKKYPDAIEQFEKALQPEDDKTPTYLYALGATYARAGDRQRALEYLQQAREAAIARGQTQLLTGIDRDLATLEGAK